LKTKAEGKYAKYELAESVLVKVILKLSTKRENVSEKIIRNILLEQIPPLLLVPGGHAVTQVDP